MGMVHALKKGDIKPSDASKDIKGASKSMSKKDVKDYASTKHKGLPKRVKQEILNKLKMEYAHNTFHTLTSTRKRDHDDDNNLGKKKKNSGQPDIKENINEMGIFPISNYIKGMIPTSFINTSKKQNKEKYKTVIKDLVDTLNHFWKSHNIPYRVRKKS